MQSWSKHPWLAAACLGGLAFLGVLRARAAEPQGTVPGPAAPGRLAFQPGKPGELVFDTGVLKGTLHRDGKSSGVQQVMYLPSKTPVAKGNGWFTHYRVITADTRYPKAAWTWTTTAKLLADGAAEIRWEANDERPFQMTATYRLAAPDTVELVTAVTARKDLRRFEIFLASYFEGFASSSVYAKASPLTGGKTGFLEVTKPVGGLVLFPRDEQALAIVKDGRWQPKSPHVIGWQIMPQYARALAMRRDEKSGLVALLMAPPKDCFAISTYYGEEPHRSVYLSMFGRDIPAGQTDQARCRLVIGPKISPEQAIERYEAYVKPL